MNREESVFFGALDRKTALLESKPRRYTSNHLSSSIAKKSTRCECLLSGVDICFCTILSANNRDEENWKEENREESVFVAGHDWKTTLSLVVRLAITSCLQSPSIVADESAFSVRIDICTTLMANNREEENRDDRLSHFLLFVAA